MEPAAPSLHETQRALRASLVDGDDRAAAFQIVAGAFSPAERLDVYRNTFASVLTRALHLSYPAVQRLVGTEFFEGAVHIFIARNPPTSACLDDYGAGFAEFLARFAPAASLDYLPSVARLEWAVNRALHAPDAAPLDPARLAQADDPARVRFSPHPSTSLVRTEHPADAIWRAVLDGDDAALAALDPASGPAWLLVHRSESGVEVERLDEAGWRFTEALFTGRPLHRALEETPYADAQTLLAAHLAAGRFSELRLR